MIFTIFIVTGGFIIQLFTSVMNLIPLSFITPIFNALQIVASIVGILWSFLPFVGIIIATFIIIVPAHVIRYTFSILLWIFNLIPFIGKNIGIPQTTFNSSVRSRWSSEWENGHQVITETSRNTNRSKWGN